MKKEPWSKIGGLIVVLWLSILAIYGCGDIAPIRSTATTENGIKSVVFYDDFSHVPSGWGIWENEKALVTYEDGGLRFLVNQPNYDFWSVAGRRFENIEIEVDVNRRSGPEDNDFGLICRYQDARNFYMFLVSSDGYYGIAKLKDDVHSLIGSEQLQYSNRIPLQQREMRLRADCVGDRLSLYVDGFLLMEARDTDFTSGDVGLLAGAYATPGVDILFDNFEVRLPE